MSSDPAAYPVRPVTENERAAYSEQLDFGFHESPSPEAHDLWQRLLPTDQTLAAFDGDELVSTGGHFRFRTTVPGGGAVDSAGVTAITVKATHRRRGILTSMMRHQLDSWHESGEAALGILQASEPAIYGRFGYALGVHHVHLDIPRGDNGLSKVPGIEKFRMRMVDPDAGYERCQEVYDANVPRRPGMMPRPGGAAGRAISVSDLDFFRQGAGPLRCVLALDPDGSVAGFARYRVKEDYSNPARPGCKVRPREVYGSDLASYAALWRFLCDLDLTSQAEASVPADDPLLFLLDDTRAATPTVQDKLYVRVVDVDRALAGRRYAAPVDVVFEVGDPFCPWNTGRWRLTGDADGAGCERTSDPADLVLGPRELGAAYLGGYPLAALGRAGRIEELTPGALAAASRAFVSDIAPYLPFGF